jgi:hypothetical protein
MGRILPDLMGGINMNFGPSSLHFCDSLFLLKTKLVARKQGRCAEKASAQLFRIADFGFRIFLVFFFNPHSAIGIPQFERSFFSNSTTRWTD